MTGRAPAPQPPAGGPSAPGSPAGPPHSAVLRAKLAPLMPLLWSRAARLWESPSLAALYPRYLCMLHGAVRATVPLMDLALERALLLARTDPVAAGVARYLARHRREEAGHDVWLREDLAALGQDPDPLLAAMPATAVADLVGAQYYWVRHHHPVCLLGHIAVLEGYPPPPGLADALRDRTGFPDGAFRTLRRHAVLDVGHRDALLRTVDALPLAPEHHAALGVSALHTLRGTVDFFDALLATAPAPRQAGGGTRRKEAPT